VAHVAAKLMSYKDEYEVARLMTDPAFAARLQDAFEGDFELRYNLAPPLFSRRDPRTGRPHKRRFGKSMSIGFDVMRRLRPLRGTPLDIFGYGAHRRLERALITDYFALVDEVLGGLKPANVDQAEALLRAHDKVRGYDIVKEASIERVRAELPKLREAFGKT
jgi:indolepyruvate ferredoxin oxidoreductase